jgi:hypothetical protein
MENWRDWVTCSRSQSWQMAEPGPELTSANLGHPHVSSAVLYKLELDTEWSEPLVKQEKFLDWENSFLFVLKDKTKGMILSIHQLNSISHFFLLNAEWFFLSILSDRQGLYINKFLLVNCEQ